MTDLLCITCGYQLTGLKTDGPCPECGTPIEKSLGGQQLSGADQRWLRRIIRGQTLLDIGLKMVLICVLLMVIVPLLMGFLAAASGTTPVMLLIVMMVLVLLALLGQGLASIGAFMVTAHEARLALTERAISARSLTRSGMLAVIVLFVLAQTLNWIWFDEIGPILSVVSMLSAYGAFTVTFCALLRYLAGLAPRIPDLELQRKSVRVSKVLQWSLPMTVVLFSFPAIVSAVANQISSMDSTVTGFSACFGLVFFLITLIMLMRASKLMTAYRRAFKRCLEAANSAHEQPGLITAVPADLPAPH